jgi:hypothetical protein
MCINGMKTLKQDTSRYMQQSSNDAWFAFSSVSGKYSRNGCMSRFTEVQVRPAYTSKVVAATVAAARRTLADAVKVDAAEADGDGARAVESLPVPADDVAEGADEDDGDPPKNGAPEDGAGARIMETSVQ